ncbi:MAG: hypothetical protein JZU58_24295 [Curvibacter lanceolatus]|uniref:hypothetical protein n=1 Tax=Curvibacter lanceolatus TaxID=86182 RepID=UPI00035F2AF9|nr:hypothetical protein [Curvibacter lanceolatus]MBV5295469.1 hypothetical protein [Curvibacter lanceolatus]
MRTECPRCHSEQSAELAWGRKTGGVIGLLAGVAAGSVGLGAVASTGPDWDIPALAGSASSSSPVGQLILSALVGATAGCAIGARLGEAIDEHLLHNRRCLECGHRYSVSRSC